MEILRLIKPKEYGGSKGQEVKFLKGFEDSCNILVQHINREPKNMTVLEYLQTIELVKEIVKKNKKRR